MTAYARKHGWIVAVAAICSITAMTMFATAHGIDGRLLAFSTSVVAGIASYSMRNQIEAILARLREIVRIVLGRA